MIKNRKVRGMLLAMALLPLAAGLPVVHAQQSPFSEPEDSAALHSPPVDLDVKDVDLPDVLRMFAKNQNLNLVFGPEVTGKITVTLRQLPWPEALTALLRPYGFDYYREGSLIWVVARKQFVSDFSATTPQVQISAKIVEIGNENSRQNGVSGSWLDAFDRLPQNMRGTISTVFPLGTTGMLAKASNQHMDIILQALETEAKLNVLSNPKIVVLNNQEAVILVGDKIPFRNSETVAGGGVTVQYTMQEIGVKLSVTPQVIEGGKVVLKIRTEASTLKELRQEGSFQVPVIGTREAKTMVIVADKTTVAIGGLMKDEARVSISRVPVLGKIPFLGALFSHRSVNNVKTELLIFISPEIIKSNESGAGR